MVTQERDGYWQQTFSGQRFWVADPRPEDIYIIDIAHQLAMDSRYNGATLRYYSVAEHSVHVSRVVPPEDALWGLLHDASETWLRDLIRPVKRHPDMVAYMKFEARVMTCVCDRFGLLHEMPASVAEADERIVDDERRQLLANMEVDAGVWSGYKLPGFGIDLSKECEWREAKELFLARFHELTGGADNPAHGVLGSG